MALSRILTDLMHISAIEGPRLQEGLVATQNPTNITSCDQPFPRRRKRQSLPSWSLNDDTTCALCYLNVKDSCSAYTRRRLPGDVILYIYIYIYIYIYELGHVQIMWCIPINLTIKIWQNNRPGRDTKNFSMIDYI